MSLITQYERHLAGYLESRLTGSKVQVWADAFNTDGGQRKNSVFFLGHQRTERISYVVDPTTLKRVYTKRYFIEFREELFTIKNHQRALDLIEYVLDEVLNDYQPYYEVSKFTPQTSGEPRRNKENGSWIYTGIGYVDILSDITKLTPINSIKYHPNRIIQIGFENILAEPDNKEIGKVELL
ncbi:MAG: hypothetical protein ACRDBG_23625 [Waterburya sp.]